jgi:phosphopantetheine adenylyltransferase
MIGDRSIYTFEHDNQELQNEVHRLREKIKKIQKINDEAGATGLTKQVMIKSIIDGLKPEAYRSFNVDEGEE